MATYYVRKTGSDANAGTSAALAWATIGKALQTGSPVTDGDTIVIGAGVYRELVLVNVTGTATGITVLGDVDGASTGDVGEVVWTAYDTNDTTAPASSICPLRVNGKDLLTFQRLHLVGSTNHPNIVDLGTGSQGITFRECKLSKGYETVNTHVLIIGTGLADTAWNLLFDRCIIEGAKGIAMLFTCPTSATADYDTAITVQNCIFTEGADGVRIATSGTATGFGPIGVKVAGCTMRGLSGSGVYLFSSNANAGAITVTNCYISSIGACLRASVSGQIVEDHNRLYSATPRTLVTAGTGSVDDASHAQMFESGESVWLRVPERITGTPKKGSPLLGFTPPAGQPSVDFANRPRPAGGQSAQIAVGALERHDSMARGSGSSADGGSGGYVVQTGPADDRLFIAVDAVSTTISIKFKTASYVGTNYPRIVLLDNAEIGVATQTVTAGSAATIYTTLTLSAFTPTAKGVVTLRLDNRTGDGAGQVFWDTLAIS
jgi:hypothetical protein